MALSNMTCLTAKPRVKSYKIADGEGLYLEIAPNGTKYWRLKYRLHGKEKRISIGAYPAISIADARRAKEEIRKDIRLGIDPVLKRIHSRPALIPYSAAGPNRSVSHQKSTRHGKRPAHSWKPQEFQRPYTFITLSHGRVAVNGTGNHTSKLLPIIW